MIINVLYGFSIGIEAILVVKTNFNITDKNIIEVKSFKLKLIIILNIYNVEQLITKKKKKKKKSVMTNNFKLSL